LKLTHSRNVHFPPDRVQKQPVRKPPSCRHSIISSDKLDNCKGSRKFRPPVFGAIRV
jgi:hypothetical protein